MSLRVRRARYVPWCVGDEIVDIDRGRADVTHASKGVVLTVCSADPGLEGGYSDQVELTLSVDEAWALARELSLAAVHTLRRDSPGSVH